MAAYSRWSLKRGLQASASCPLQCTFRHYALSRNHAELYSSEAGASISLQSHRHPLEESLNIASLLRFHSKKKSLSAGKVLHALIITFGFERNILLGNCLIGLYDGCGSLHDAQSVFDHLEAPNVFSWNLLLHAYGQHASLADVRNLFDRIPHPDVCSWNTLIKLVSQHGCIDDTRSVFDRMPHRNIVSWNAMIAASSRPTKYCHDALFYFLQMQIEGVFPDKFTFVSIIDACSSLRSLVEGKIFHVYTINMGIAHEPMVGTAVINLYDKFGLTEEAFSAFKTISCIDTIALTAMIACFSHSEQGRNALNLFYSILPQGMQPDKITYVCALDACASISTLDEGKEIHSVVVQVGLERNPIIQTALVNMYGKGFSLCDALWIFWNMPNEDAIPWTVMIGTLAENEEHENALSLFYRMCSNGLNPDEITFICVLDICAGLGMLEEGHTIHSAILEECLDENVVLANNLINMYGKCACLDEARNVFNRMLLRSTITWNTLLGSYALSGQYMDTILLFQDMMNENKVVDDITCLCVLTACSHAGFVEFGMFFFASIYLCHRVIYTKDHYVCAVDLLGRAGHLEEAEVFIHCIPFTYFPMLWLCLLGACKAHGDLARGARSGKWCIALDPTDPAPCIALMNIYSHFDLADLDE